MQMDAAFVSPARLRFESGDGDAARDRARSRGRADCRAPAGEVRRVGFESVAGQTQRPQVGDVRRAKTATDLSRDVEPLSQRDYGPESRRDGVGGQLIVRPQSLAVD